MREVVAIAEPPARVTETPPMTRTKGKWWEEWCVVSPLHWLHWCCRSDSREKKGTPFGKVQPDGPAPDVSATPYIAGRRHPDTRERYCLGTKAASFYCKPGRRGGGREEERRRRKRGGGIG